MREIIEELLPDFLNEKYANALEAASIIKDYFGESLVDIQRADKDAYISGLEHLTLGDILPVYDNDSTTITLGHTTTITIPQTKWRRDRELFVLADIDEAYRELVKFYALIFLERNLRNWPLIVLVRFPKVTVTNENDASIDITELYVRIDIQADGRNRNGFKMIRAEYPVTQWISNYAHSHLPGVSTTFQSPCLGNGPILGTLQSLNDGYDPERWGLFCYELAKYVTVESLAGVPYRRLESVGNAPTAQVRFPVFTDRSLRGGPIISNFLRYYVRNNSIPVAFVDGTYVLGCNPVDLLVSMSKCFIDWYNKREALGCYDYDLDYLIRNEILSRYIVEGKRLFYPPVNSTRYDELTRLQGRELFKFKGDMVRLNFLETRVLEDNNVVILLHTATASNLLLRCLRIINYEYGQKDNTTTSSKEACDTTETKTAVNKKVRFI